MPETVRINTLTLICVCLTDIHITDQGIFSRKPNKNRTSSAVVVTDVLKVM